MRSRVDRSQLRERLFRISVLLKGVDAVLEIAGGVALLLVPTGLVLDLVAAVNRFLVEDPRDPVAKLLGLAAQHLYLGLQHFWGVYLLGHGAPKLLLVGALLQGRLWAYPIAIVVFAAFVVYQLYLFTLTHDIGLMALSLFDVVVIWLIWLEYRAMKSHRAG